MKKLSYKLEKKILILMLVMGVMLSVYSMNIFWRGFHNADLCSNEMLLAEQYGVTLYEQTLNNEIFPLRDCYLEGLSQLITGFYIYGFSFFMFGLSLGGLIVLNEHE